jgi:hypothetical protein
MSDDNIVHFPDLRSRKENDSNKAVLDAMMEIFADITTRNFTIKEQLSIGIELLCRLMVHAAANDATKIRQMIAEVKPIIADDSPSRRRSAVRADVAAVDDLGRRPLAPRR